MNARHVWTAALVALSLAATAVADDADKAKLGGRAREVFQKYCHQCHQGPGSKGGDADFLDFKFLVESAKTDYPWLIPGKPEDSPIYNKASQGLTKAAGGMPPPPVPTRPEKDDVETIKAWIAAGCPDAAAPPKVEKREPISSGQILASIKGYLEDQAEQEDRRFLRFFTLSHLHNDPNVTDAQLQLYRAALAEAVNHLSWRPRIVQPAPVDTAKTIFVIDLRDFDWDKTDVWMKMLAVYPYGLEYRFSPKPMPGNERFIVEETGCPLPYVRGDWFAATTTRPPLYHDFLNIPTTARVLETKLGVEVADNFRRNRVARAGFKNSGVSKQHRLVERHDALYGAYWKSYDFKSDNARGNLLQYPLGPARFFSDPRYVNPFADAAFEQDGGEMIFNLPNGLQGYMLVDGKDGRIDIGPINVVNDPKETSGTPEIVNGLSCMACHSQGMRRFAGDVVRGETPVRNRELRKVELIYPLPLRMNPLLDEDQERFMRALEKTVGGYYPPKTLRSKDWADPIGIVAVKHLEPINIKTAANELGVTPDDILQTIGREGLRKLNLGGLAMTGGTVKRQDWESGYLSPMQRLAEALNLARAKKVSK